ncbi:ScbR family autoregulator-binding transcription factor [Streptomyces sp. MA15]|uniref:ScbR family autoregulator-binding transcription factor n=1 Tax=Streptomyces sp. MA15 TaxID=3055061 RepID=UPI0025B26DA4|nr:ScbR family autoregulator-binding transcription factor [Streptomyces sp. MA15]MDN3270943.1 ScbR family autoregulator-binding transcription factor [Streptomyces sp. MA15]
MREILQERARATRRSLLEAAACLFAQHGYAGTSVNDISARSGRTSGSVYFHYASKEGIAQAVVRNGFATWPSLVPRYDDPSVPPLERLVALSYEIARALAEDSLTRAGARLWAERHTINADLPDPFVLWTAAATRLLAEARAGGCLAAGVRPAAAARTLVRAFYGFCTLTEALEGPTALTGRLSDWWKLVLPALQRDARSGQAPARQGAVTPAAGSRPPSPAPPLYGHTAGDRGPAVRMTEHGTDRTVAGPAGTDGDRGPAGCRAT